MDKITNISETEKEFFAGCIKSMIMADGKIDEREIQELEKLQKELGFSNFDKYLINFEEEYTSSDQFWEEAKHIENSEVQTIILKWLTDISLIKGYQLESEKVLLKKLNELWPQTEQAH